MTHEPPDIILLDTFPAAGAVAAMNAITTNAVRDAAGRLQYGATLARPMSAEDAATIIKRIGTRFIGAAYIVVAHARVPGRTEVQCLVHEGLDVETTAVALKLAQHRLEVIYRLDPANEVSTEASLPEGDEVDPRRAAAEAVVDRIRGFTIRKQGSSWPSFDLSREDAVQAVIEALKEQP